MKSSLFYLKPVFFLVAMLVIGSAVYGQSTEAVKNTETQAKQVIPAEAPSFMAAPVKQQQTIQQPLSTHTGVEIVKITRAEFNTLSAEKQQFILDNPTTHYIVDVDDIRKVSIVTPERMSKLTEEQLKYIEENPELFIIVK